MPLSSNVSFSELISDSAVENGSTLLDLVLRSVRNLKQIGNPAHILVGTEILDHVTKLVSS